MSSYVSRVVALDEKFDSSWEQLQDYEYRSANPEEAAIALECGKRCVPLKFPANVDLLLCSNSVYLTRSQIKKLEEAKLNASATLLYGVLEVELGNFFFHESVSKSASLNEDFFSDISVSGYSV